MKEDFLNKRLTAREENGLLRKLSPENNLIDFSSNDYLGFARSGELKDLIDSELKNLKIKNGSTGSRLLTGNTAYVEELEKFIAEYHNAEAGLIFNSGYDANLGLITAVAKKDDLIYYDELSHASVYDGIRLAHGSTFPFRHNDLANLEGRLKYFLDNRKDKNCFVIVESVYSMDGDFAPLEKISELCEKYNAHLIVDEAHATGIFGPKGEGRVLELNLLGRSPHGQKKVFARVHTFGKALGCHGAIVLGSQSLRNYLINFARSFIYTTALPFHSLTSIKSAYELLINKNNNSIKINNLINLFKQKLKELHIKGLIESSSPIQSIIFEGNETVKKIASLIQKDGFDVRPILSPTVPKGKERIRICLHTFNTEEEINALASSLEKNSKFVKTTDANGLKQPMQTGVRLNPI